MRERGGAGLGGALGPSPGPRGVRIGGEGGGGGGVTGSAFALLVWLEDEISQTAVSPETSSQNGDVGGYRLRGFMLKTAVSPETSSKNEVRRDRSWPHDIKN